MQAWRWNKGRKQDSKLPQKDRAPKIDCKPNRVTYLSYLESCSPNYGSQTSLKPKKDKKESQPKKEYKDYQPKKEIIECRPKKEFKNYQPKKDIKEYQPKKDNKNYQDCRPKNENKDCPQKNDKEGIKLEVLKDVKRQHSKSSFCCSPIYCSQSSLKAKATNKQKEKKGILNRKESQFSCTGCCTSKRESKSSLKSKLNSDKCKQQDNQQDSDSACKEVCSPIYCTRSSFEAEKRKKKIDEFNPDKSNLSCIKDRTPSGGSKIPLQRKQERRDLKHKNNKELSQRSSDSSCNDPSKDGSQPTIQFKKEQINRYKNNSPRNLDSSSNKCLTPNNGTQLSFKHKKEKIDKQKRRNPNLLCENGCTPSVDSLMPEMVGKKKYKQKIKDSRQNSDLSCTNDYTPKYGSQSSIQTKKKKKERWNRRGKNRNNSNMSSKRCTPNTGSQSSIQTKKKKDNCRKREACNVKHHVYLSSSAEEDPMPLTPKKCCKKGNNEEVSPSNSVSFNSIGSCSLVEDQDQDCEPATPPNETCCSSPQNLDSDFTCIPPPPKSKFKWCKKKPKKPKKKPIEPLCPSGKASSCLQPDTEVCETESKPESCCSSKKEIKSKSKMSCPSNCLNRLGSGSTKRSKRKKIKGKMTKGNSSLSTLRKDFNHNCCACCKLLSEYTKEVFRLLTFNNSCDFRISQILCDICKVAGCLCNDCFIFLKQIIRILIVIEPEKKK